MIFVGWALPTMRNQKPTPREEVGSAHPTNQFTTFRSGSPSSALRHA